VANRQYRDKLKDQAYQADPCRLWQGLSDIRGYKSKQCKIAEDDASLPDALNAFYARFERNTNDAMPPALTTPDTPVPSLTTSEVRTVLRKVNPRKAMGPDGVSSRALSTCADQLAEVLTDIFNLYVLQQRCQPVLFCRI